MQFLVEHVVYQFLGKGDLSQYDQYVEEGVKVHHPPIWQELSSFSLQGRDNVKFVDQQYASAFQIKKIEISDMIFGQNKALVRWGFCGFHKGDLFEMKASHRNFDLTGQTIYQFNEEEKIEEVWQAWDLLGLLRQIKEEVPIGFQDIENLLEKAAKLSVRERECMKYLLRGKTAKETSCHLKISFRTVEYYFENIKNKLGCFNKRELISYAHILENFRIL